MSGAELFNHFPSGAVYSTEDEIDYDKEKVAELVEEVERLKKRVKDLEEEKEYLNSPNRNNW